MTIDWWTLGLQAVNVVILIWLLQRFFWKPVAAIIEERRMAASKALGDAETARAKAEAALVEIDKTRAGFAAEREKTLADAHAAAEHASAAKLAEAGQKVEALLAAGKATVAADEVAATQAWAERSSDLAVDIAKRMAARLGGSIVHGAFLDWALTTIRTLPVTTRQAVTGSPRPLETTSATPLDSAEQQQAILSIGKAFGAPVQVVFKTDPSLIAGLEMRADHLAISNSWRADLAQIRAELTHDE